MNLKAEQQGIGGISYYVTVRKVIVQVLKSMFSKTERGNISV